MESTMGSHTWQYLYLFKNSSLEDTSMLYGWRLYLPLPEFSLSLLTSFFFVCLILEGSRTRSSALGEGQNITLWKIRRINKCPSSALLCRSYPQLYPAATLVSITWYLINHSVFWEAWVYSIHFLSRKGSIQAKRRNTGSLDSIFPSSVVMYTHKGRKPEESSWEPYENSSRFPDRAGKIQILFPQVFNPLCKLLSQLLFILQQWSIPTLISLCIASIQLHCISLQYCLSLCQK